MSLSIGLAQCAFPADGNVIAQVARLADDATRRGVDLLVFPECLTVPPWSSASDVREAAQPLEGPFARSVAAIARERGLWIVATLYEVDSTGAAPFNTAFVVDGDGNLRGAYRKCHLYDAHGELESERTQRGDQLFSPIETSLGRLGLGICYDLRFPEVARQAAAEGCELMLYPAAWIAGPHKIEHWRTLLRARAIENELFVAGICRAGTRHVGHSLVADPLGRVVAEAPDQDERLVCCHVDLGAVKVARTAMPILEHRRPDLYGVHV